MIQLPTFADVQQAAQRIASQIHRTPVMTCESVNRWIGCQVYFKCENLQKTGAFKFRGACNAIACLTPEQRARGVVTHSSGNHAGALAAAAQLENIPAHIVMPENSAAVKRAAVEGYGGRVTSCGPSLASRLEVMEQVRQSTGATLIPPFDHPNVIAGQGTCAMEFLRQVPQLDTLVSPIGGGGLVSGTCLAVRGLRPDLQLWGAEPAGADDAYRSKQLGAMQPMENPQTICDGLRTSLGEHTWPFVRDEVDEILLADDQQTAEAMKFVWERSKLIIETSAAVVVAALALKMDALRQQQQALPQHVGVIACGGNVDLTQLPW